MRNFFLIILLVTTLTISLSIQSYLADKGPTPYKLDFDTTRMGLPNIPLDNPLTVEGVALGRLLFYDPLLSGNNTQSCGSCHKQEFSFSDAGNPYSKGIRGKNGKRNTMSLINLAWQDSFFWDGRIATLEEQILFPIKDSLEMDEDIDRLMSELNSHKHYPALFKKAFGNQKITPTLVTKAIAQFLRTIFSKGLDNHLGNTAYLSEQYIFDKKDSLIKENSIFGTYVRFSVCASCHTGRAAGNEVFANNQLDTTTLDSSYYYVTKKQSDIGKFKAPSLINILYTAPYMHDGRLSTIDDVMAHYSAHLSTLQQANPNIIIDKSINEISEYDKKNIKQFLTLFTDTNILKSEKFSNPFNKPDFKWGNFPNN